MTEIHYQRARMPSENDVIEVVTSNHLQNTGRIFFRENNDVYKEVDSHMDDNYEAKDYILGAAKALIREKDAKEVKDENGNTVAKLKIGDVYHE